MTVTRRLRISCDPVTRNREPQPEGVVVRNKIERYKSGHSTFEDFEKQIISKAAKKAKEDRAKKIALLPWFFFWAHVLLIIEYTTYRIIWG